MSRNRHKSWHEKEKSKKKCRVHRVKYEKGRNERDIAEKNEKKRIWSKWLNFISRHWCGRMKNETNPLDIYTRAPSADVFDIPLEPKPTVTRAKMAIPEDCSNGSALSKTNFYCVSKQNENSDKKETEERLMQYSYDHQEVKGGKNLLTSGMYFSENATQVNQSTDFVLHPKLWNQSGVLRNSNESSRDILENPTSRRKIQIPEVHSEVEDINRTSGKSAWNGKAEIYHRRQVKAGIDNLLGQLICIQQDRYTAEYKKLREKKRLEFDFEGSMVGRKGSASSKISRQVSPAILVNIKPFKKQITQTDLQENFSTTAATNKFNLTQVGIKKQKRLEEKFDSQRGGIGKENENFQFRCPVIKNQVIAVRNFWDADKEKPVTRKEAPEHQNPENREEGGSVNNDFCFVVGLYRSYDKVYGESGGKSLDEVLENLDGRDHNVIFKKNMRQFRKKIISGSIKGEEKETGRREPKPEKGMEAHMKMEKLGTERILATLIKFELMLGISYDLATKCNILRTVFFLREEIHVATVSRTVREICQCHETYFTTVIQKRFSNVTTLLIREIREIRVDELKRTRTLYEVKYCMKNVKGVARVMPCPKKKASNIFFITRECSTPKQPEPVEPQENITDLLGFLQEYSKLVEKSCSGDDFIEIEKILSTVAKSFIETENESSNTSININVVVENVMKDHTVVQILNNSALEYLALIYQTLSPRNCSGKSFSETDLHKRRKQAITLNSQMSVTKDIVSKEFRQRGYTPTSSVDGSQNLYNDLESLSDEGDEIRENYELRPENLLDDKQKVEGSRSFFGAKKLLMFKSSSFPGEISTARDYRAQKSRLFKDFHKDMEKKTKSIEKGPSINKGGNPDCLGPEKPVKVESDSAKFQKYPAPDQLKNLNENGNKKMFFIEENAGKLRKEVIAAFSTIKDLSEEKDSAKTSVVIMLSRK